MRKSLLYVLVLCLAALAAVFAPSAALGSESCPNEQLRAESSVNTATGQPYSMQLPDCRGYELVSPADTGGFPVPTQNSGTLTFQVVADGSVFFESSATPVETGAIEQGRFVDVFRSRRTSSGWVTRDLTAFGSNPGPSFLEATSADGSSVLIGTTLSLSSEDVDNPRGRPELGGDLYVVREGESPQFVSHGELPFTGTEAGNLGKSPFDGLPSAEDVFGNSDLSAVGFISSASLQQPAGSSTVSTGCYEWVDAEGGFAFLTNPEGSGSPPPVNCKYFGVTADGRSVIEDTSGDSHTGLLFASAGGNSNAWPSSATNTVRLSGNTAKAAVFDALSPDGETVYLATTDKLVANSDSGADVYAINLKASSGLTASGPPVSPAVTCVSCAASGAANGGAATWVGQSSDGSHVFFSVGGALYEHDSAGTRLVAPAGDSLSKLVFSADGEHVIATTSAALSGQDTDAGPDVYEFNEGEGFAPRLITSGTSTTDAYTPVAVSDDGRQVLYTDKPSGAPTVIEEWADRETDTETGQISPLGATKEYAVMGTAGGELEDVFFEAYEPLVAQDENAGTVDIYDARLDGGFPVPVAPPNSNTTANPQPPGSTTFGANLAPPTTSVAELPPDTSQPAMSSGKKSKPLTRAQKLSKALKSCHKDKSKTKRAACEKTAHKKYAAKKGKKK